MADLEERTEELTQTMPKKLISKAKATIMKHSSCIIATLYLGTNSWLGYKADLHLHPINASLEENIFKSLIGAAFIYVGFYNDKENTKKNQQNQLNKQKKRKKQLDWGKTIGIINGVALISPILRQNLWLLQSLFSEWHFDSKFGNYVILEESPLVPNYKGKGIGHIKFIAEQISVSTAYAGMLMLPIMHGTKLVYDGIKTFVGKESKKFNNLFFKYWWASLRKEHKKAQGYCAELESLSINDYKVNISRALTYIQQELYSEAVLELKKAKEKLPYRSKVKFLTLNPWLENTTYKMFTYFTAKKLEKRLNKDKKHDVDEKEIIKYYDLAQMYIFIGKRKKAITVLESLSGLYPEDLRITLLFAEELLDKGTKKEKSKALDLHKKIYEKIKHRSDYNFEGCGETTKSVKQISSESDLLLNATYIYKTDSLKETRAALENQNMAEHLRDITLENLLYGLANTTEPSAKIKLQRRYSAICKLEFTENLVQITENNQQIQVIKRSIGDTLLEKLTQYNAKKENPVEENVLETLTMLAFIHAKMPIEERKKRGKIEYFEQKIEELKILGLNTKTIDLLTQSYIGFNNSPFVFNKDAHPENWIIETGITPGLKPEKIIAIDWDEKGTIEQVQELVNLLDYTIQIPNGKKMQYIAFYLEEFLYFANKDLASLEQHDTFQLNYLNSKYERLLGLCCAWSSPKRPKMQSQRQQILTTALNSVVQIKVRHSYFYREHEQELISRIQGIEALKKEIL
ncbi:hypothetical protein HN695_06950 [Candidatus Woesearchaeota archaeon]|jgi:hypothetical protein|nr:hypothetical protein [Candidatus Woesearchaeota archaeon]MBT5271902.1 hypothetical protein [Candidatus Woesearchaeota archaeon]MBT6336190.1 hypothetical protein [Candidatus Woesearchaeota archaeon]MBT7928043.1 hypothetical protein [Candidatus Woesearchaeota archaeon]